jgi:hypothetical protein
MQPSEGVSRKLTLLCPVLAELSIGVPKIFEFSKRTSFFELHLGFFGTERRCIKKVDSAVPGAGRAQNGRRKHCDERTSTSIFEMP